MDLIIWQVAIVHHVVLKSHLFVYAMQRLEADVWVCPTICLRTTLLVLS